MMAEKVAVKAKKTKTVDKTESTEGSGRET